MQSRSPIAGLCAIACALVPIVPPSSAQGQAGGTEPLEWTKRWKAIAAVADDPSTTPEQKVPALIGLLTKEVSDPVPGGGQSMYTPSEQLQEPLIMALSQAAAPEVLRSALADPGNQEPELHARLELAYAGSVSRRGPAVDPILRRQITSFVERGEFGLASGPEADGTYQRLWYREALPPEEVSFDANVFLLTKARVEALRGGGPGEEQGPTDRSVDPEPGPKIRAGDEKPTQSDRDAGAATLRLMGTVPSEQWNRLGTKVLPRLRSHGDLMIEVSFRVTVPADTAAMLEGEIRQALEDLGIGSGLKIIRQ